jgi:hypothetical protein
MGFASPIQTVPVGIQVTAEAQFFFLETFPQIKE